MAEITGTGRADVLVGTDNRDTIDALGGHDRIRAGGGIDLVLGGDGNDLIYGGNSSDNGLHGGSGADTIYGEQGHDGMRGDEGDDILYGGIGADQISTGSGGAEGSDLGNDRAFGGAGADLFFIAGAGNDFIDGGEGRDQISLYYAGIVTVDLARGSVVYDYPNSPELNGTAALRSIEDISGSGFAGDVLRGDERSNVIAGSLGGDRLTGRGGADIFRYFEVDDSRPGPVQFPFDGRDVITDFQEGVDRIDVSRIDFDGTFLGEGPLQAFPGLAYHHEGGNTLVQIGIDLDAAAELEIVIRGIVDFSPNDFIA